MPKSLYRSLEFSEGEESWSSEIYQTAHVSKGSPLEVRCRKATLFMFNKFIILLLPQVTYSLFASMSQIIKKTCMCWKVVATSYRKWLNRI